MMPHWNDILVASFKRKMQHFDIYRDEYGKWYIRVDGSITQRKLNASEIVRWFANMVNEN